MLTTILTRLREPSTYAGAAALIATFGWNVQDDLLKGVIQIAMGLAAVLSVVLSERK